MDLELLGGQGNLWRIETERSTESFNTKITCIMSLSWHILNYKRPIMKYALKNFKLFYLYDWGRA